MILALAPLLDDATATSAGDTGILTKLAYVRTIDGTDSAFYYLYEIQPNVTNPLLKDVRRHTGPSDDPSYEDLLMDGQGRFVRDDGTTVPSGFWWPEAGEQISYMGHTGTRWTTPDGARAYWFSPGSVAANENWTLLSDGYVQSVLAVHANGSVERVALLPWDDELEAMRVKSRPFFDASEAQTLGTTSSGAVDALWTGCIGDTFGATSVQKAGFFNTYQLRTDWYCPDSMTALLTRNFVGADGAGPYTKGTTWRNTVLARPYQAPTAFGTLITADLLLNGHASVWEYQSDPAKEGDALCMAEATMVIRLNIMKHIGGGHYVDDAKSEETVVDLVMDLREEAHLVNVPFTIDAYTLATDFKWAVTAATETVTKCPTFFANTAQSAWAEFEDVGQLNGWFDVYLTRVYATGLPLV